MVVVKNTSQDPEYVGPTYHEKKFHKTHFEVKRSWNGTHPSRDPNWVQIGVGRWMYIPKETRKTRRNDAEVTDASEKG